MRNVLSLLFVLSTLGQLHAQPEPSDALEALALVPAYALLPENGGLVTFTDWAASFAGRGVDVPSAWSAPGVQDRLPELLAALPPGAPPRILEFALMPGGYPDTLGIELFDITGTVEFGQAPAQVLALRGEFDRSSIQDAFTSRDYVVTAEVADGLLLCPVEGCDQGLTVNLPNQDPANPFGGRFGRRQPALAADDYLISTPAEAVLEDVARVIDGAGQSLAQLEDVQALVELLSWQHHLLTLTVINPLLLSSMDPEPPGSMRPPLPAYSLAAYAATIDWGFENGQVILIYDDRDTAMAAGTVFVERLELDPLLSAQRPATYTAGWSEHAELTGILIEPAGDRWAVTVQLSTPVVPFHDAEGNRNRTGVPYLLLMNELLRRDTLWLQPGD